MVKFFLAGSWNDWKDFKELKPFRKATYRTSIVPTKAPGIEEFQVVQDRDWKQRFYPSESGDYIRGPDDAHGANWRVHIPRGCARIEVVWTYEMGSQKEFKCRFRGKDGSELPQEDLDALRVERALHNEILEDETLCSGQTATENVVAALSPPDHSGYWEIVGGVDAGGLLVREGADVSSPAMTDRLATGAVVEELVLLGSRLHFRKCTGEGPDEGWISVLLPGKVLAERLRWRDAEGVTERLKLSPKDLQFQNISWFVKRNVRAIPEGICLEGDRGLFRALWTELQVLGGFRSPMTSTVDRRYKDEINPNRAVSAHVLRVMQEAFGVEMHFWWANLYEDGSAGCCFHNDAHQQSKTNITLSASFGAGRDLTLRHNATRHEFPFPQGNGSIFAFSGSIDERFEHGVHPHHKDVGPRISIILMGRSRVWEDEIYEESLRKTCEQFKEDLPRVLRHADEELQNQLNEIQQLKVSVREERSMNAAQLSLRGWDVSELGWTAAFLSTEKYDAELEKRQRILEGLKDEVDRERADRNSLQPSSIAKPCSLLAA